MNDDDNLYRSPAAAKTWVPAEPPVATELAVGELPPAMSRAPSRTPSLNLIVLAALVLCVPGNVVIVPISDQFMPPSPWTLLVFAIGGSIGAQAALLTILVVWGSGPLWLRLLWHWGLAAVALLSWCAGWLWTYGSSLFDPYRYPHQLNDARPVACGLLLCSLLLQGVPWILRVYFGWQIRLPSVTPRFIAERLSIRDLLVGTVLTALAVAAARIGRPGYPTVAEYWLAWLAVGIWAVAFALVAIVPMVYFTLSMRSDRWGIGSVVTLSVVLATCLTILLIATGADAAPVWWFPLAVTALVGGFSGGLAGALWIARAYGYRLVIGRIQCSEHFTSHSD